MTRIRGNRSEAFNLTGTLAVDGLEAGDLICQFHYETLVAMSPVRETFNAWLSDNFASAAERLDHAIVPYARLTEPSAIIADNWADFIGCLNNPDCLQAPILRDEFGVIPPFGENAWTGTGVSGETFGANCLDWTDATSSTRGMTGNPHTTNGSWTRAGETTCNVQRHLYCFEQ